MKLNISREILLIPLQQIIGVVERKQTIPTLSNVLIKAHAGNITITATDLEIELISNNVIPVDEDGVITLPARKLLDICKNLPNDANIILIVDGNKATISTGRSRFKLSTLPAIDFPALEDIKINFSFIISQAILRKVIEKTAFAMAQQDVRYYLNGLMLELSGNMVRSVATDGHRLALCETDIGINIPENRQVIIPRKGVLELIRLLDTTDIDATVSLSSNHIRVDMGSLRFTSKLIDGRFPDYQRVMPVNGDKVITTDKQDLRLALTRTSILSNEKYKGVRLSAEADILKIQTNNPEQEEAEEELEVQYNSDHIEIGFNVNYMLDVLNSIEEDAVTIELKDSNSSCLVQEIGDQTAKYVIMPMRL